MELKINTQTPEDLYKSAVKLVIETQRASAPHLQRNLHIGYSKSVDLIERLEEGNIIETNKEFNKKVLRRNVKIYLDIDGTLIHEELGDMWGKPAAGLEDFITALKPYDVYWLTTHCRENDPIHARKLVKSVLPESFHDQIDSFKPVSWNISKTEALDWGSDFIWIDNDIFVEEREELKRCRDGQSVVQVDLRVNSEQLIDITKSVLNKQT